MVRFITITTGSVMVEKYAAGMSAARTVSEPGEPPGEITTGGRVFQFSIVSNREPSGVANR